MNNREPQVGDVRWFGKWLCRVITNTYDGKIFYRFITSFGILLSEYLEFADYNFITNIKYLWKLAPRYKRLFGIYYIKDKSNDQ